jgi:hypothetical protein
MGARDEIFPTDQHPAYVQTQWAKGWGYNVIGFGDAARLLTEQRAKMHATVDQIGLAVIYLQRHRVELVIKQALVDLGKEQAEVATLGHSLEHVWRELGTVVKSIGGDHWRSLVNDYAEFIAVMHEADEGSFSYRYPIDRAGAESKRADFINLEALQRYAEGFEYGVHGYTDMIAEGRREAAYYDDDYY